MPSSHRSTAALDSRCLHAVLRPQYRNPATSATDCQSAMGEAKAAECGFHLRVRVLFAAKLPKHGQQAPCVAEPWDVYHPTASNFAEGGRVSSQPRSQHHSSFPAVVLGPRAIISMTRSLVHPLTTCALH